MVLSNHDDMMRWNVEGADEHLLLHTLEVSKKFERVLIKTVDSYVVITETAAF